MHWSINIDMDIGTILHVDVDILWSMGTYQMQVSFT